MHARVHARSGRRVGAVKGLSLASLGVVAAAAGYVAFPRRAGRALRPSTPFEHGSLVSVVIGTVGRPSLRQTVQAVLDQTYPSVEVVVVDNAPGSGRVDSALEGLVDPRCRVLREPIRGVSAARNTGVRNARGEVVAFTDDDAEPDAGWIEALVNVYSTDTEGIVSAVTGRVVGVDVETPEQRWFEDSGMFDKGGESLVWIFDPNRSFDPRLGSVGTAPLFPYTAGEMGSGNNMSFRRTAFLALNGFDELIGPGTPTKGGEDLELFRRAILQGGAIVYSPQAVVGHHHRATNDELREQMFGYGSGMSAILTKLLFDGGAPAMNMLARVPSGIRILLAPASRRFADGAPSMPLDLKAVELLGYICGPYLYSKSLVVGRRRSDS